MKKIISIILVVLMIIGPTPAAFAAEGDYIVSGIYEGGYYAINENTTVKVTTTSLTNDIERVVFVDGETETTDAEAPYEWSLPNRNLGAHTLEVYVHDIHGGETLVETINYTTFMGIPVETISQDFEGEEPTITTSPVTDTYSVVDCANLDGKALRVTGGAEDMFINPGTQIGWNGDIKVIYQEFDVYHNNQYGGITVKFGYPEYAHAHGYKGLITDEMVGERTHVRIIYDIVNKKYSVYQGDTVISEGTEFSYNMMFWNDTYKKDFSHALTMNNQFTADRPVYFDNFKTTAYKIAPALTAEMVRVGDSSYKITFSNNLLSPTEAEDYVDLFDIDGNMVTAGVTKTSGDNYVMLTLDESQIENISDCSIEIAESGIFDEYSQEYDGRTISFEDFKVTGITLDKSTVEVYRETTHTLVATVFPEDAMNKSVIWSSSDETIATVDQNGVVRGKKAGEATITATTVDGDLTDSCIVTVKNPIVGSVADERITKLLTFAPGCDKVIYGGRFDNPRPAVQFTTDNVRVGNYSAHYVGPGASQRYFQYIVNVKYNGAWNDNKYLKMWIYNAGDECELTHTPENTGSLPNTKIQLNQGWNLFSLKLGSESSPDYNIDYSNIFFDGYINGISTTEGKDLDLYFSEPWLETGENLFTVAEITPAAGEENVSNFLRNYRVTFSNNILNKEKAMAAVNLYDANNELIEGVTKSAGTNYVDINIYDNVTLDHNTTYTVKINSSGLYDMIGQELKGEKEFSFTTVAEGRNLNPYVELISPVDLERYFEGEPNTLKAKAIDDDGAITSVKFYNGDSLIGVGTPAGEDIYTFEWTDIPISQSFTDLHSITAVACDDEGATSTSAVSRVLVYNMKAPTLEATFPPVYYNSVNGAKMDKYAFTGTVSDLDGMVVSIKVIEDENTSDEKITIIENPFADFAFTFETDFELGEHTIKLIATDDTGQETTLTESFTSVVVAKNNSKKLDSVNVKDKKNVNQFKTSIEDNKKNITIDPERGVVISSDGNGNIDVTRTAVNAKMNSNIWQMDATVSFDNTTNKRVITMAGKDVVTFDKDGHIKTESADFGKYAANTNYTISLVAYPTQNLAATLLDGVLLEDTAAELLATDYEAGVTFKIVQYCGEGETAETVLANYGCYEVGAAATNLTVGLAGNTDLANVPVTPGEIQIAIDGGIGNGVNILETVQLIDVQTGKSCLLELKDGKLMVGERLIHDSDYVIKVSSDFFNTSGATALGDFAKLSFKTASKPLTLNRAETGFTASKLEDDATSATFNAKVKNANPSMPKTVYVVCAVYDGDKMITKAIEGVVIDSAEESVSVTVPISNVTENMSVQAFIVENLLTTNTATVTEEIFSIK